ncbi:MAG: MOSC domain-containing protein [Desulfuromonas sp.]|nr:MAG: MOSC domain-containing protein [Desulfuromonas sp.]
MSVTGRVVAVCVSMSKGMKKRDVGQARLLEDHGIEGDAHAGPGDRQISLLALESIDKMRAAGLDVGPGDFAENLAVEGLDLCSLPVGTHLLVGSSIDLEITRIGKVCHQRCEIYFQAGDCVMPREGIFAVVRQGGEVVTGDVVRIVT